VGPAASAQRLTTRIWTGVALSVVLALAEAWLALALAYETDWPTTFWITALSGAIYLLTVPRLPVRLHRATGSMMSQ
jgi:zinc/manganese transport system permease protein